MSIERSSSAASPKNVAGAEGTSGKGKAKSGDEADAAVGGGFSAILTSLEPSADQGGPAATPSTTDDKAQTTAQPAADSLVPLASNLPTDLAMLLAQAGRVVSDKLNPAGDPRLEGVKGGVRVAGSVKGADQPALLLVDPATLGAEKATDIKQKVDGLLDQVAQAVPGHTHKAGGAETAASLADARAMRLSTLADVSAREPALSGALVTSAIGDSFLRQTDRAVAKSSALPSGFGVEGAWGQHTLQAGSRVDTSSVMVDPSMQSTESMVADTVSYWVTQGVQNAQLKLDGFGAEPVQVSITLKGDEAHIGFRTDQPEIRQILEGAVAHLKELLTNEGLVLSGVSVGTSGQDGAAAQDQRSQPDVRQATIVTTDKVQTESRRPAHQSAGRTLDLFV